MPDYRNRATVYSRNFSSEFQVTLFDLTVIFLELFSINCTNLLGQYFLSYSVLEGHLYHIRNSGDQLSGLVVTIIWLTYFHFIHRRVETFWEKVITNGIWSCNLRSYLINQYPPTNPLAIPVTTFWLTRKVNDSNNDKDLDIKR